MVSIRDKFGDRLCYLGHFRKNLWLELLWEHPVYSINGSSIAFDEAPFVTLEVGV